MNTSFSKSALKDLEQDAPHIVIDFVTAMVEHVGTLSKHPDIGRMVPDFNDELILELIHFPFRVVYLRESKSIRVWRSKRILHLPK